MFKQQPRYRTSDATTKRLMKSRVYKVKPYQETYKVKKEKDRNHSFWQGLKYVLVFSILLWWMPIVGQAVAGYLGGKKTGSPFKGFAASFVPVDLIIVTNILLQKGYISTGMVPTVTVPTAAVAFATQYLYFLVPYFEFSANYFLDYFLAVKATSALEPSIYMFVVGFAILGGYITEYRENHKNVVKEKRHWFRRNEEAEEVEEEPPVGQYVWTRVHPWQFPEGGDEMYDMPARSGAPAGVSYANAQFVDLGRQQRPRAKPVRRGTKGAKGKAHARGDRRRVPTRRESVKPVRRKAQARRPMPVQMMEDEYDMRVQPALAMGPDEYV